MQPLISRFSAHRKVVTDLVSCYLQPCFPVDPAQALSSLQQGGTAAGPVYSAVCSPGPGEKEDVFRASLIMAASEEINRQGPAGMLQLLLLKKGEGQRRGGQAGEGRRWCGRSERV